VNFLKGIWDQGSDKTVVAITGKITAASLGWEGGKRASKLEGTSGSFRVRGGRRESLGDGRGKKL